MTAATTDQKLRALTELDMTSAEIGLAAGIPPAVIAARRRGTSESPQTELAAGIDALYGVAELLGDRHVPAHNVRAFVIGRSPYLEQQRPAVLMSRGHVGLVRDAALAYARGDTPEEFRRRIGPIPRLPDPIDL